MRFIGDLFAALFRPFIRASAFLSAEIYEILRQPRLILTLVLGPFLILLLFGIGYQNKARNLRTLFVVEKGDPLAQQIEQMAPSLGGQLIYKGVTDNKDEALNGLREGQLDLVAVAPPNATQTIQHNQQATFTLYHNEIDPVQVSYVEYFGRVYMDEVNRRVLEGLIQQETQNVPNRLDPKVMVSPFAVKYEDVAPVQPSVIAFFSPAVIVLLLQHLAVTFGALSIVREARLGTMELFRVSPLNAGETLVGKYLAYLIFSGILSAILTAVLIFGLRVPLLGDWQNYALVVAALLFAALGYGLVISLISQTDSQAIQYAMLLLLTTVFFSGFFTRLDAFVPGVRALSWALPGTYAILLLQDIMMRGQMTDPALLYKLIAVGLIAFVLALFLLRRKMART